MACIDHGSRFRSHLLRNGELHLAHCDSVSPRSYPCGSGCQRGGVTTLLVGVAIGSSLGMVLPISTPPNAIAASTGMIEQKDMVKTGLIMGVLGLVLGYGMLIVLGSSGFFG